MGGSTGDLWGVCRRWKGRKGAFWGISIRGVDWDRSGCLRNGGGVWERSGEDLDVSGRVEIFEGIRKDFGGKS